MSVRNELIFDSTILRGVVGSTVHGLAIEGQDDRDEMGIFIEPPEAVCGLSPIDHLIQRDQPDGVRSQPGDLDLTMYSLRKFCRLATAGNPSVILLLWLPSYTTETDTGRQLINLRHQFISKESGKRFLGYLRAQKARLKGESSPKVSRPELVEKYGYDTKFAMHALRLGLQGIELLQNKHLSLPMEEPPLTLLRNVRLGNKSLSEVLQLIETAENYLRTLINTCCDLKVDKDVINKFMVEAHRKHWG
jgi:predicted nucleotidyltransferase